MSQSRRSSLSSGPHNAPSMARIEPDPSKPRLRGGGGPTWNEARDKIVEFFPRKYFTADNLKAFRDMLDDTGSPNSVKSVESTSSSLHGSIHSSGSAPLTHNKYKSAPTQTNTTKPPEESTQTRKSANHEWQKNTGTFFNSDGRDWSYLNTSIRFPKFVREVDLNSELKSRIRISRRKGRYSENPVVTATSKVYGKNNKQSSSDWYPNETCRTITLGRSRISKHEEDGARAQELYQRFYA